MRLQHSQRTQGRLAIMSNVHWVCSMGPGDTTVRWMLMDRYYLHEFLTDFQPCRVHNLQK